MAKTNAFLEQAEIRQDIPIVGLTEQWETALDARLAMSPTSPVRVLDDLLRARRESRMPVEP